MIPYAIGEAENATAPGYGLNNGQQTYGPFVAAGVAYMVCCTGATNAAASCDVYKSLDGIVWTGCDLGGSGNDTGNFAACFDGASIIRVFWAGKQIAPISAHFVSIQYADFDTLTETWIGGAGGGPVAATVSGAQWMANGVQIVICNQPQLTPVPIVDPIHYVIFDGGVWTGADLTVNAAALGPCIDRGLDFAFSSTALSADGETMHVTFTWTVAGVFPATFDYQCYQAINQDGTLGGFASMIDPTFNTALSYRVAELAGQLVFAYADGATGGAQEIIVTPALAPVLVPGVTVDPAYPGDSELIGHYPGTMKVIDGILYLYYVVNSPDTVSENRLRLLQTINAVAWTGETTFDGSTDSPLGWTQGSLISPGIGDNLTLSVSSLSSDVSHTISYGFLFGSPVTAPVFLYLNQQQLLPVSLPDPSKVCA